MPPLDIPELIDESMEALLVAEMALERLRLSRLRRLEVAEREPYFGRLDFQEQGNDHVERFYIGKAGVARGADQQPYVIDWRAPVASLFYNSATGGTDEAAYESLEGRIAGVLWLKRNIGVTQGVLQRIVDSKVKGAPDEDEPILDEFLHYRLQESRDSRLRDIVATIQGEQNAIIRAPMDRPLIIQGVAGSGKTTVALHRLAYLLYTFREKVAASRIIIFAPTRMFLDYIADVLPELGVDGVVQTTFADWALAELNDKAIRLTDNGARLATLFAVGQDPGEGADAPGRFKGSLLFKEVLDLALIRYEEAFVPDVDLTLWQGGRTLAAAEVADWFHGKYQHYPLMARKERCMARIKKWAEDQVAPWSGRSDETERRKQMRTALQKYIKLWPAHTPAELYREIVGGRPARRKATAAVGHPDIPARTVADSLVLFQADEMAPEDLAPLVYLKARLWGYKENRQLDHVVIDEAQDFSPFQLDLLTNLTRDSSFTILGDLSQGIHAYQGIQRWEEFMECFGQYGRPKGDGRMTTGEARSAGKGEGCSFYLLEQSYRSTYEVMTFANQVLSQLGAPAALAKPVFRSGAPVRWASVSPDDLAASIAREVADLRERNHASIAVIGRTEAECEGLARALTRLGLEPELITARQNSYKGGLSIIPAYLVKGLEFDAVIIADATADRYQLSQRDAKLLYVACTRALHELVLLHSGEPSPLLPRKEEPLAAPLGGVL